jgi:acyl-CoA thioesterase
MNNKDQKPPLSKRDLAQKVISAMFEADTASQERGMKVTEARPDYAEVTMTIRADMLNGHKTCHGGIIFTLADSAFAFACNTDNIATVAQGAQINFLKPAFEGDILTAAATVTHQGGRTGLCDVTLTNQNGQKIAFFRGNSYRLKSESVKGLNIKKPI